MEIKHKETVVVGCAFCADYQGSEEVHAVFIHPNINRLCQYILLFSTPSETVLFFLAMLMVVQSNAIHEEPQDTVCILCLPDYDT